MFNQRVPALFFFLPGIKPVHPLIYTQLQTAQNGVCRFLEAFFIFWHQFVWKGRQNVIYDIMMGQRAADADAEPDEPFTTMGQKALDAIVTSGTAAGPDT